VLARYLVGVDVGQGDGFYKEWDIQDVYIVRQPRVLV
jgi:hypothetical protein